MIRQILICIFLLTHLSLIAQTFTGKVKCSDGEPLAGASVVASAEGNSTIAYCITNNTGFYKLTIPGGKHPKKIVVSYIGYQKKTLPLSDMKDGMTIIMSEGGFKLKEVKVKAERIQSTGDTLTYSVAGFMQAQDRSIADVIAKMPGLEVKTDGSIEYQGKPINKFYIEGLDLMGSQYGVASNNISAGKVRSVQVMENHQAVKSLRGVTFSDQAAINLVLKDDAKAAWAGAVDAGLGYGEDLLYDCRMMGMRFNKKFQTLMMYKNNDMGKQIDNEVIDLASLLRGRSSAEPGILSMMNLSTPDLAEDRYTFNHSHILAGNWLWKTGKDTELRLQGSGFIDKTDMQTSLSYTYLTVAGRPVVVEEKDVTNTRSEWKGEASYQYNSDRTFIKNNLRGYIDFNKSAGYMLCNSQRTDMMAKPRKRSLTEDFQLSHTTADGNVYKVNSFWAYNHLPGQLLTITGLTEQLHLDFFSTQNDATFKYKIGRHYLNNVVGIDYDRQKICVAIEPDEETADTYELLRTYWTPSMSFLFGKHRLDAAAKLSYAHQTYKTSRSHHLWLDPSIYWNWKPTAVSELSVNLSYTNTPLNGRSIYNMPIFTDCRTIRANRGETDAQHTLLFTAGYKYTNPVAGVFFNIRPMFNRTSGNILYRSRLADNIYISNATGKDYDMQTLGLSARIHKTFGWGKTLIALGASHNETDYSLLVSDEMNDARMKNTCVGIDYSLRPIYQLSVEGKSNVNIYEQENLSRPELSSGNTTDWQHFVNLHFFPAAKWMLSVKNELFHTDEEGADANYFLDLALSYKAKRWELSLTVNNIIGTSKFERRVLGSDIESYSVTRLRPRESLMKWSFDL